MTSLLPKSTELFAEHPRAELYWYALQEAAHHNTEKARAIVEALRANKDYTPITPRWCENDECMLPENVDRFFDHIFITFASRDPQLLTWLGLFEAIGITDHNAYLNDLSYQELMRNFAEQQELYAILKKYDINKLSPEHQIAYKNFTWMLDHAVAGKKFVLHEYRLTQMFGVLFDLAALLTQFHPLKQPEDVEHYLARLEGIEKQFDHIIEILELQKNQKIITPAFALERVCAILKHSTPQAVTDCLFYTHLAAHLPTITDDTKPLERAQKVLAEKVYPAYHKLHAYCTELHKNSPHNHGVWALPEGDAFYAYMLKQHITVDMSPQEVHELGRAEVERITREMRDILVAEGLYDEKKSVSELVSEHTKKPEFYYPDTREGRAACLADFEKILARSRKELAHLFDRKPQALVTIKPVPQHEEAGQAGAYYCSPTLNGSRPGMFFVNLRNMAEMPKHRMETLLIHEAEPGHHFQIGLQQEMPLPILAKIKHYTAHAEGWALYAEKLAYEHGFYSSPFSRLGHLQDELLRAARLVVDTGIHYKRWNREQAIDYMADVLGWHRDSIVSEVERYFVMPGQACAYKIGQLKILELRDRARKKLGDRFDIRDFHNIILKAGSIPLTLLEEIVDAYIIQEQKNTINSKKSQ